MGRGGPQDAEGTGEAWRSVSMARTDRRLFGVAEITGSAALGPLGEDHEDAAGEGGRVGAEVIGKAASRANRELVQDVETTDRLPMCTRQTRSLLRIREAVTDGDLCR